MLRAQREFAGLQFTVIVPTRALLDQWFVGLQEDLGFSEDQISLWSGRPAPRPALVNIMIVNTARWAAERVASEHPTMLIADECHRYGSPYNALALKGDYVASLGISATPEREYDDSFETAISPHLGPIIYRYGLNQGLLDGVIVPFELINVSVDLLDDERTAYDRLTKRIAQQLGRRDESEEVLKHLLQKRARVSATASMRVPVATRLVDDLSGLPVMVFHEDINEANRLCSHLVARGHSATIYHSKISPSVRRDNLRLYRRGVFDVLVSCRALDEGVNIPETRAAIIASGTASLRQRVQRLGRALRPAPGKDCATIYTLYATEVERQRLEQEAERLREVRSVQWKRGFVKRG